LSSISYGIVKIRSTDLYEELGKMIFKNKKGKGKGERKKGAF
jgi:hypothetical protein